MYSASLWKAAVALIVIIHKYILLMDAIFLSLVLQYSEVCHMILIR